MTMTRSTSSSKTTELSSSVGGTSSSSSTRPPTATDQDMEKSVSSTAAPTMSDFILTLEKRVRRLSKNKNTRTLLIAFLMAYVFVGLLLYFIVMHQMQHRHSHHSTEEQLPDELIQEMLNEGVPPEILQAMLSDGVRPVKVKMVVRGPGGASLRGAAPGSIEEMFGHDPFLAALMGQGMQNMQDGPMLLGAHHDEHQIPENPIMALMQQQMQHQAQIQQLMEQGAPPEVIAAVEAGVPLENIRVRQRIRLALDDGNGHKVHIQVNGPQQALNGFFPKMSADDLMQSGALNDIIGSILKDIVEHESSDASPSGNAANALPGGDDGGNSSTRGAKKRILVMTAAEDDSDFAGLEAAMKKKFKDQGYDGVHVQNFKVPRDFIDSEDFSHEGYHDINDLGVFPKIMHEVDEHKNDADQSHTQNLLNAFCHKIEALLVHEPGSEFTSVNQVQPELLQHAIDNVAGCSNLLDKLQKTVDVQSNYVKTSWRRTEL